MQWSQRHPIPPTAAPLSRTRHARITDPAGEKSIRIRSDQGGDGMSIDRSTAKELELITDARSGGQKKSL